MVCLNQLSVLTTGMPKMCGQQAPVCDSKHLVHLSVLMDWNMFGAGVSRWYSQRLKWQHNCSGRPGLGHLSCGEECA